MKLRTLQLTTFKRIAAVLAATFALGAPIAKAESLELLNVSYDPTREL